MARELYVWIDNALGFDSSPDTSGAGPASSPNDPGSLQLGTQARLRKAKNDNRVAFFESSPPDLANVQQDGPNFFARHLLWVDNPGGREFSRITHKKTTQDTIQASFNLGGNTLHTIVGSIANWSIGDVIKIPAGQIGVGDGTNLYSKITAIQQSPAQITIEDTFQQGATTTIVNPKQVTIEDTLNFDPYKRWAIGGRRRTLADSHTARLLQDAKAGWSVRLVSNGTPYTGGVTLQAGGNYSTGDSSQMGSVMIEGYPGSSQQRTQLLSTTAVPALTINAPHVVCNKIYFRHTTAGSVPAAKITSGTGGSFIFEDCEFASVVAGAASHGLHFAPNDGVISSRLQVRRSYFHDCQGDGLKRDRLAADIQSSLVQVMNCYFKGNVGKAVSVARCRLVFVFSNVFYDNAGSVFLDADSLGDCGTTFILHNTMDGNGKTGHGIQLGTGACSNQLVVLNNVICRHNGWAISNPGPSYAETFHVDHNCLPASVQWRNSSGGYQNLQGSGSNDVANDPGFVDPAGDNFNVPGSDLLGKGYPKYGDTIGGGETSTVSFVDIGAVQEQDFSPVLRSMWPVR